MNRQSWNRDNQFENQVKIFDKGGINMVPSSTQKSEAQSCVNSEYRRCEDGSCVARGEMCPEELLVNQTTVFIMITVGIVAILLLVIFYCFQKRSQRLEHTRNAGDDDNTSLNLPPPTYEEVVSSSLYSAVPGSHRNFRVPSSEEPRTPPPNYDSVLYTLAQSNDSISLMKDNPKSLLIRRSVSTEYGSGRTARSSRSSASEFHRLCSSPEQR